MSDFNQYFKGLKKTIEGKDNYYFLVNDTNNEIRQHYDDTYENSIDLEKFIQSIISKKHYLNSKDINYEFFVIPDKSVTARAYLPFETSQPKRIVDYLGGYVHDLKDIITLDDVLKNDTHISIISSLKITPYILSVLHGNVPEYYSQKIKDKTKVEFIDHKGDLFFTMNWSYPQDDRFKNYAHMQLENLELKGDYTKVELENIPEQFRRVSKRKSEYYINPNSISDKKALILRDSSTNSLITSFIAYYREVFFYWDHWYFNKDLVEWYNPDDVIEIRTERFIERPNYPMEDNDFKIKQDLILNLDEFKSYDKQLHMKFDIMDYYNRIVDSDVDIYINDNLFVTQKTQDGLFDNTYDLSDFSIDYYNIKVVVKSTKTTNEFTFTRNVLVSHDIKKYFKDLKLSLKGKDNTFFLVNDNTNELLQHYDLEYESRLNLSQFKLSLNSKRKYLSGKNIKFTQFILPDKSVILRDYLPFETAKAKRHWDSLKNYYYDLSEVISKDDYIVNDTKITSYAALKAVSFIIFKTFKQESFTQIKENLLKHFTPKEIIHQGDLFTEGTWSYAKDDTYEKYSQMKIEELSLTDKQSLTDKEIPPMYAQFNNVKSKHIHNYNSISDKRALIICDKTIHPLFDAFTAYFSQVFFYHDFWYFNKDLIDYLNPDVVIEVRSERFLDTALTFMVNDKSNILIPVKINVDAMQINDNNLVVNVTCKDIRNVPVESSCKFFIDEEIIAQLELQDGNISFNGDVSNLEEGVHELKIRLEQSKQTKARIIKKQFNI